jgi:polar amino acid transport system substrate-binding protein
MLRSLIAVLLAGACASASTVAAPLRAGGFIVAPLIVGEPGKPLQGALRDFLEREVVPAGVPLQWMPPIALSHALDSLRDGSLDVLLLASGEAARLPGTAPFGWTYLHTRPYLAVRRDSPLQRVATLDQLAGLEIGWLVGPRLSPGLVKSGARWQLVDVPDWQAENLRRLQAGKLDAAYFENEYSPRYLASAADMPIRLIRLPMPPRAVFMIYSLKADKADIARFDRVAKAAFAGRRFHDFLDRYTTGVPGRAR